MIQRYEFSDTNSALGMEDSGLRTRMVIGLRLDAAKLEADCKRYREALEDIVSIEERRDRGTALVATIARETLREAEDYPTKED